MLVLALSIAVGGRAGITLKKQQLTNALIGIDPSVSTGTVAEFKGEVTLPARFCRGGIHDDSKAGIGALAQADHGDVCLLYTSPSPRDRTRSRMPSSA